MGHPVVAEADYRIKLPVFEGPLDLLLFLIRKAEIDIYDIPIEAVTRQYLAIIRSMQQLDLEVAGEFFVMAATLMEIKSRMLLPRGEAAQGSAEDDEPVDPRWELVHQLVTYRKFKEAASRLDGLATFQQDMLPRIVLDRAPTEAERDLKPVDRIELWHTFNLVLRRLAEKLVVGEIKDEAVTVADQMEWLLERTRTEKQFLFSQLFPEKVDFRTMVATFLAVLELTRLRRLRVRQAEAFADIECVAIEETPPAPPGETATTPAVAAPDDPAGTAPSTEATEPPATPQQEATPPPGEAERAHVPKALEPGKVIENPLETPADTGSLPECD